MPDGSQVHLGVYDIAERDHEEIQRRADDFLSLVAYLRERDYSFSANQCVLVAEPVSAISPTSNGWPLFAPAFETRNGLMPETNNRYAARFARESGKRAIRGSERACSAVSWQCIHGGGGRAQQGEFFAGLRAGRGRVRGSTADTSNSLRDVLMLSMAMIEREPCDGISSAAGSGCPVRDAGQLHA